MIRNIFGLNERRILENRKPLVRIAVEVVEMFRYEDRHIAVNFNKGNVYNVDIYANGEADMNLGDFPDGGGYVSLIVPLSQYKNYVRPVKLVKIFASTPYSEEISRALNFLSNMYGFRL